ncbi:MAG TPA: AraC family ligand binding domain-containing protein [Candidatus Dojkabacteria bacterium]|jgi:mannose-6-phosphate isomerase-like protein (cupin superfamily)
MSEVKFEKKKFLNLSKEEIREEIKKMGFIPIIIYNIPDYIYERHNHKETKLLVFLKGGMELEIEGRRFDCKPGDLVIIPGLKYHSAVVGKEGCEFFWSEKDMN